MPATISNILPVNTWVNVVRCLLLAGVGHEAVVGVCPACWGNEETPLPGEDTPPETDESPLFGSGFSFLNAPSAVLIENRVYRSVMFVVYPSQFEFNFHISYCYTSITIFVFYINFANKFKVSPYITPLAHWPACVEEPIQFTLQVISFPQKSFCKPQILLSLKRFCKCISNIT